MPCPRPGGVDWGGVGWLAAGPEAFIALWRARDDVLNHWSAFSCLGNSRTRFSARVFRHGARALSTRHGSSAQRRPPIASASSATPIPYIRWKDLFALYNHDVWCFYRRGDRGRRRSPPRGALSTGHSSELQTRAVGRRSRRLARRPPDPISIGKIFSSSTIMIFGVFTAVATVADAVSRRAGLSDYRLG